MFYSRAVASYKLLWHQIAAWMICLFLAADMASGFSIIYLGVDLKISLIYKVPLFALILVLIASYEPRQFLTLVSFILFSFIGPLVQFF